MTRKERREQNKREENQGGTGYLSLRTRKLDGFKDDEEKDGEDEGEDKEDDGKGGDDKSEKEDKDEAMKEDEKGSVKKEENEEEEDENNADDDDEDDEEDEDDLWQAVHSLAAFAPLNVGVGNQSAFDSTISQSTASPDVRLLFGNMHLYVFFRLYQKLYTRLADARVLSIAQDERLNADALLPRKETANPVDNDEDMKVDGGDKDGDKAKDERQTTYAKFMEMLINLVEGQLDNGKFEDDCRVLLGTNSYELYTLDKVVEKLLGQAQSLTSEASAQSGAKLLALHEYEQLRNADGAINNSLYRANAATLTDTDSCYAFYSDSSNGALSVQLIDYKDVNKVDSRFERRREEFLDELLTPIDTDPSSDECVRLPFLKRSIKGGSVADVGKLVESHGLELMFRDDRLSYAKHTEDSMFRSSCTKAKYQTSGRSARMRKWQEMRLEKIPAEAAAEAARKAEEEAERIAAEAAEEEEEEEEGDWEDKDEDGEGGENEEDEDGEAGGDGDGDDGMDGDEDEEGDDGEGDGEDGEDEERRVERGGLESLMQAGEEEGREAMDEDEGEENASQEGAEAREEEEPVKEDKEQRGRAARGKSEEKEKAKEEEKKAKAEEEAATSQVRMMKHPHVAWRHHRKMF